MKHLPSDKHTIAWFKLAEFVARGEKEKALGIYKLLMLSVDDEAFACKLEGDILFSFNDQQAIEKYYHSAVLYQKEGKAIEAAAIYETLLMIFPESKDYINKLIDIYTKLHLKQPLGNVLKKLCLLQIKLHDLQNAIQTLEALQVATNDQNVDILEQLSFELIDKTFNKEIILKHINKTLNEFFLNNDRMKLQQFLSKLEVINKFYHQEALEKIKDKHES